MTTADRIAWREYFDLARAAQAARDTGALIDVVIVGEDNPYSYRDDLALADLPRHCAGGRLRERVLGCPRAVYLGARVLRHDLCRGRWSAPEARAEAARLAGTYPAASFVLLGRKVREAFGLFQSAGEYPVRRICAPAYPGGPMREVVCLPHPSGRNPVWNDPAMIPACREALRAAGLGWLVNTTVTTLKEDSR